MCDNLQKYRRTSLSTRVQNTSDTPTAFSTIRCLRAFLSTFGRWYGRIKLLLSTDQTALVNCTQRLVESTVLGNDVNDVAMIYTHERLSQKGKRIVSQINMKEREIEDERLLRETYVSVSLSPRDKHKRRYEQFSMVLPSRAITLERWTCDRDINKKKMFLEDIGKITRTHQ